MAASPESAPPSELDMVRGRAGGDRDIIRLIVAGAVCLAVGLLLGRTWAADSDEPGVPRDGARLRVSLAAHAGGLDPGTSGVAVVVVPLVVENAGVRPIRLIAVKVRGPGAGVRTRYPGGPPAILPLDLPPRRPVPVRLALTSDCGVSVRPEPTVTFVVEGPDSQRHRVQVRVPDLASIWGQTLQPEACPT